MPASNSEKYIPAESLHPVRQYGIGLVAFGDKTLIVLDLEGRDGTSRSYAMSLASAVTFCSDMQAAIESDAGISALVRETLADARAIKHESLAEARDPDGAAARCGVVVCDECGAPVDDHKHGECPSTEAA